MNKIDTDAVARPQRDGQRARDALVAAALVALLLASRLPVMLTSCRYEDADEAAHGIMAMRMASGRPGAILSITPRGPGHGIVETYLASLCFRAFGASVFSLRLVGLASGVATVLVMFFGAARAAGFRAGVLAALFYIASASTMVMGFKVRGGYAQLHLFGALLVLLSVRILCAERPQVRSFFWLGLAAGLGYLMAPSAMVCLAVLYGAGALRIRSRAFVGLLGGGLLGMAPMLWFNLPRGLPNLRHAVGGDWSALAGVSGLPAALAKTLAWRLPMAFSPQFDKFLDRVPTASWLAYGLFGIAFAAMVWQWSRAVRRAQASGHASLSPRQCLVLLLLLNSAAWVGFYAFYHFHSHTNQRYLFPLFAFAPMLVALFADGLISERTMPVRVAGWACVAAWLGCGLVHNVGLIGPAEVWDPWNVLEGDSVSRAAQFLEARGIRCAYAHPIIGYRLAFESREAIVVSSRHLTGPSALPDHEALVHERACVAGEPAAFVFQRDFVYARTAAGLSEARWQALLHAWRVSAVRDAVGDLVIYHSFSRNLPALIEDAIERRRHMADARRGYRLAPRE